MVVPKGHDLGKGVGATHGSRNGVFVLSPPTNNWAAAHRWAYVSSSGAAELLAPQSPRHEGPRPMGRDGGALRFRFRGMQAPGYTSGMRVTEYTEGGGPGNRVHWGQECIGRGGRYPPPSPRRPAYAQPLSP